jgi:hypothetical protein
MGRKQIESGRPEVGIDMLDPFEWSKLQPIPNAEPVKFSHELLDENKNPLPVPNVWKFSADIDKKNDQNWSITGQRFVDDNEQPVEVKGWTQCELFVHNDTGEHIFNRVTVSGRREVMLLRVATGVGSAAAIAGFAWAIYRHHKSGD